MIQGKGLKTAMLAVTMAAALAACGSGSGAGSAGNPDGGANSGAGSGSATTLSSLALLGEKLFNDTALSVSGQQSCATCHVAQYAYAADPSASGPDHGGPVALGGPNMDLPGLRNTPALTYASYTPAFFFDGDGAPNGGYFRDGRAATLADQAVGPFTTPFEMANADAAEVITRLRTRPYLADFEAIYGADVLSDPATALRDMGVALAAFETEEPSFHPFSSKYDAFVTGKTQLSAQELRGLAAFNDPSRGNCAACHPSTSGDGVTPPLFTDFSYDNLGVPRNTAIEANNDATTLSYVPTNSSDGVHRYYDLGICGPLRDDGGKNLSGSCGQFKVPSLRNIALTAPYFHNGRFASLVDAVTFYVQRDTNPEKFYPVSGPLVTKFDDLPGLYGGQFVVDLSAPGSDAGYVGNVNTLEIPYNRLLGDAPALSATDINDVVAFLCTLTDGFDPANPSAQALPEQCQAVRAGQ